MSKSFTILKNQFEWNKQEFYSLIALNICVAVLFSFFKINDLIGGAVIMLLGVKSVSFARYASIMPSVNANFDRFSWKYLQGLAISKKELLLVLSLSRLLVCLPFIFWMISFFAQLNDFFLYEKEFEISKLLKILSLTIPIIVISGFTNISSVITFPRIQYQKIKAKERFNLTVRNFLMFSVLIFYTFLLNIAFELRLGYYINKIADLVGHVLMSWWMPVVLIALGYVIFIRVIKIWSQEKLSYKKTEWIPRRDLSLTLASALLLILPVALTDFSTPKLLGGHKILKLVYTKDIKGLNSYIKKNGKDVLYEKNKFGFTPLLVAIRQGDVETYQYLKKQGAIYRGESITMKSHSLHGMDRMFLAVKSSNLAMVKLVMEDGGSPQKINGVSGNSLLHVAASTCREGIIDYLIHKGALINIKNNKGLTPAHIASREKKCFGPLVALTEAGADLKIKDKEGKRALDHASKKKNKEILYYLEKHSRAPAQK